MTLYEHLYYLRDERDFLSKFSPTQVTQGNIDIFNLKLINSYMTTCHEPPKCEMTGQETLFATRVTSDLESVVAQSCPTLGNPMDCSPPGFSVHAFPMQKC